MLAESAPARLRPRRGALRRRARALDGRAGPLHPCAPRWAGAGRGARTRTRWRRSTARYRAGLEGAGLVDEELFAWRALDALPRAAARPGAARPCSCTGSTTSTRLELDALETLADGCGADVTVSLPYEPGRHAFKAVSGVHQELLALRRGRARAAADRRALRAGSREALHHLERLLFEDEAPAARSTRARRSRSTPRAASAPRSSWSPRRSSSCSASGVAPGDVAVVFREPRTYASLVEQVFGAYGIPYSIDRKVPLRPHRPRPRPARADPRPAPDGTAEDLLAYLRTPGLLRVPGLADRLEAEVRARRRAPRRPMPASAGSATAGRSTSSTGSRGARDTAAFVAELETRLARLFAAPYERTATVLSGPQLEEARALSAAQTRAARAACRARATAPARRAARAARARAARGPPRRDAPAGPRPGGDARGDPRAPLRGGVRLRPPGGRVPARRLAGAVPVRTTTGARSPPRAGSCCPCARTGSTASAICSTSARRAPSGGSC